MAVLNNDIVFPWLVLPTSANLPKELTNPIAPTNQNITQGLTPKPESRLANKKPLDDDRWVRNQEYITLRTSPINNETLKNCGSSAAPTLDQVFEDVSLETDINDNDIVLMIKPANQSYTGFVISYDYAKNIDISPPNMQTFLIFQKLQDFSIGNKLNIQIKDLIISKTPTTKKKDVERIKDVVEIKRQGTTLFISPVKQSVFSEGTLSICETGKVVSGKKHFDIIASIYNFPISIAKFSHQRVATSTEKGYHIVEQKVSSNEILAAISSEREMRDFFSLKLNKILKFNQLNIELQENGLTKKKIDSWREFKLEIKHILFHLHSPKVRPLVSSLLAKLPFAKNIRLQEFFPIPFPGSTSNLRVYNTSELEEQNAWTPCLESTLIHFLTASQRLKSLSKLELFNVNLEYTSFEKMKMLRDSVFDFSRSRDSFQFIITNFLVKMSSLPFLVLLTSVEQEENHQLFSKSSSGSYIMLSDPSLSLFFSRGVLESLVMTLNVMSYAYADIRDLCLLWKLPMINSLNCDMVSFHHNNLDYKWMFQANNLRLFDYFRVFNQIEGFCFERNSLVDCIQILSKLKPEQIMTPFSLERLVFRVRISDSKSELDDLLLMFCKQLKTLGIETRSFLILVECDETGWGFHRFTLTKKKTTLAFNNVMIDFPADSTEDHRIVAVEVHNIPLEIVENVKQKRNLKLCTVSPIVCVDHNDNASFLQPVSIYFLYPSVREKLYTRVFSKHDSKEWQVMENAEVVLFAGTKLLLYESKSFSPVMATFRDDEITPDPTDYIEPYFTNCAFVTILPLEHRLGNVIFDCVEETNESGVLKYLKVTQYFEMRKIGKMNNSQHLFAKLEHNLTVQEPRLEHGDRMHFFCPFHVSNEQEYKLKRIDTHGDWHGFVHYFLRTGDSEKKLFHLGYQLPKETPKLDYVSDLLTQQTGAVSDEADERKPCLNKALFKLSTDLQNAAHICLYLISNFEMTVLDMEKVDSEKTRSQKNIQLLKHVLARGPKAYDVFRRALVQVEEPQHLIDLLPNFETPPTNSGDDMVATDISLQTGEGISESERAALDAN